MPTFSTDRPLRFCDRCLQLDDHPRHSVAFPSGGGVTRTLDDVRDVGIPDGYTPADFAGAVEQLTNANTSIHHIDCGADAGCPECVVLHAANPAGLTGDALLSAIVNDGIHNGLLDTGLATTTEVTNG